ncbi:putative RNA binding protein [Leishmania infantum JPCM5]|uniref:RNA_binding_protein_-_putative n=2 Tax=Leishmania infantum TaxID=5671 RepID=A0A6L0XV07_LEIIN|nr:putative RNA binding protein [Leishmania infantum JPCM5]CAC9508623.1 RNA_binding_protein_-_putative [Leishmania infantum]CAM69708.1 putative RNA binding protein [Leishmania infantum JPCM5]SUZ43648.1 RNA_binding_protein_-_putative [Leishmania infantum]|eukprot:XP_001466665.1 putative RNA binding protein [Leishmania infantum JPCM5]
MTRLNSSCVSVQRNRSICQSAASPEAVLPSASILPPPTREGASAGVAYSRSDEGRSNDNVTPQTLNAVNSFVASGKTKKIASNSSRSSDSNLYQPRAAVQKNQAPATNTRSSCGAAAPRKGRSRRASTAAHATASNESNLHNSNLFICNLDTRVSQAELETAFAEHGTILSSAVMRDIHTGESLGTAFVRMSSHDEARCTMEAMNGVHVGSRSISVQWARRSEGGPVGEARKKIMKLFVRNIPLDCTKMDLEELFGAYGSVRQVTLHKDTSPVQDEAMVRLIAFVIYTEEGAAERAAREVHNTKPFASCNGIPIMVKLAEDLAKHYREHNHQQQQQQGDSTPTAAATKQRHRRSHSQRNSLTLIASKSPSHKQTISSGNAVMGLSSHTSSTTLSIHAGQSGGADASIVDMDVPSDVSFCTNYPQLTPPQCNVPPVKTPLGSMTPATLLQQHRMSCVRGAAASSAAPLSPSNALQFLATAPSNAGGRMPAVSTPTCKGAAAVPFVAGSQRPSFIDIPNSQVAQSFFFNSSTPQLSQYAPPQQQHHHLQLPQLSELPINAPVTPRLYHLPTAHAVPERQDSRAAVVLPNPRCEALPVQGRSTDDSQPIVAYSGPGEESDLRIVDTAPVAHPVSLRPQPNVKTAPPKLPQTYRHNPYISCSFIRVG